VTVDYYCLSCGTTAKVDPTFSRKKKKCPNCGAAISSEDIQRMLQELYEKQQQRQKRKLYLPMLLGFSVLVGIIVGAIAKSWVAFYGTAFVLILLSWVLYRKTVQLI
jgi:predicted RNA-binding Zn-ribbon protein involved in translation (DUF1610 family)